jgi:hypothetical protein
VEDPQSLKNFPIINGTQRLTILLMAFYMDSFTLFICRFTYLKGNTYRLPRPVTRIASLFYIYVDGVHISQETHL